MTQIFGRRHTGVVRRCDRPCVTVATQTPHSSHLERFPLNKPFSARGGIFRDDVVVAAMIDRLVVAVKGDSYASAIATSAALSATDRPKRGAS